MISKTKSYTTSDGHSFINLQSAQSHEIEVMLAVPDLAALLPSPSNREDAALWIVTNRAALCEILGVKERKARTAKPKPAKASKATKALTTTP